MNDLRPIGWYASRIAPHLPKQAFKRAPERLWGGLVYLVLTVGGIAAIGLYNLHPLLNLSLSGAVGIGFAGLGFLAHEILHGTVVKNARLRDFLGAIAFSQFLLGPKLWRKWHNMEHHAHTQEEDHDPDAWKTMEKLYQYPLLRWVYRLPSGFRSFVNFTSFTLFFSIHSQLMLKRYYGTFRPQEKVVVLFQLLWPIVMWTGLFLLLGPVKWIFAFLIPLMIANFVVIAYISTNHQLNPLTEVNDPLATSLSVTVPRWVDVLHLNFSYHTEHHLFPGMNPKWAPLVKAQAKRLWPELYHEMPMTQALASLWKVPHVYLDATNLGDPHRGLTFGSLGHGMDPNHVQARPHPVTPQQEDGKVLQSLRHSPTQGD
jgi:fatty acid desaturase